MEFVLVIMSSITSEHNFVLLFKLRLYDRFIINKRFGGINDEILTMFPVIF